MHLAAHTVGDQIPYDPVSARLGEGLNGMANVAKPVTRAHLIRRRGQTLSRGRKQPEDILGHVPHRDRGRRVCYEALVADADVQGDYVAGLQAVGTRDAVYDHGVGRGADGCREPLIPLELGLASALVERLSGRRQSQATGKIYHVEYDPPPEDDPGPFVQRDDDAEKAIRRRLEIYHDQTEPLKDYYADRDLLITVDAEQEIPKVTEDILGALGREEDA